MEYTKEPLIAIVCGGVIDDLNWLGNKLKKFDIIIAADSGYDKCIGAGVVPNVFIGDGDSVKSRLPEDIKIIKLPVKKDDTDYTVCLNYCIENSYSTVSVFGALGGRLDHSIGAIYSSYNVFIKGLGVVMYTENSRLHFVNGTFIPEYCDGYVSVFPIGGDAVVTLDGFEYPLKNHLLKQCSPLGVSNHMLSEKAEIKVHSGTVLVVSQ